MTLVEMQINIDCDGCEDKVRKALLRLRGVHYVDVDRLRGKVTVTGTVSQKKVLRAARRTGRLAVLWPSSAYNAEHHAYYAYAQPAAYHGHYQAAKPVTAHAQQHYYSSGHGGSSAAVAQYGKASSYNYHVHGYYDSDLHGSYDHEHNGVPVAARSYFSDDNPHACSII